ncbi:MAG: energy-coupling factor transporter transmembrane protein EcfT [Candidatus Aenigmarchaeota archaeon]|nr:energy-coupling factor transporter transmembrane protein EcfT [Candidatus Aenigmarchaeota archaeon]
MKNIFEYEEGNGFLYKIDPLIKIFLLVIFWIVCLYANLPQLLVIVVLLYATAIYCGLHKRFMQQIRFFFIFVFPFILAFHLFFYRSFTGESMSLFFFNPQISMEGFKMGVFIGSRLFCLLCSSTLFIITTNPLKLVKRLSGINIFGYRIPESVIFLFIFVNRSITLIFYDLDQILDAQKARGFSIRQGKIKDKIKGYAYLLIPLFTISLERAQKQAVALELKGFGFRHKRRKK